MKLKLLRIFLMLFMVGISVYVWANTEKPPWYERIVAKEEKKEKRFKFIRQGGRLIKKLLPRYKQKDQSRDSADNKDNKEVKGEQSIRDDISFTNIQKSASEDLNNIMVFLSEIPKDKNKDPIIAPVFMSKYRNIFGTRTDFSFSWVGFKLTLKFKQNKFPWKNTSFQQILIGSFVHASGTNLGFIENKLEEEKRFYTNYTSQILVFRWQMFKYLLTGYGVGSRQYFFIKRDVPEDFKMPKDHINIFPRLILDIGKLKVIGIDQLVDGIKLGSWIGYGIRSRWSEWGEPDNLQSSERARTFYIYTSSLQAGLVFLKNHNLYLKVRYKGGIDNDFISRPRFGASIDNGNLDVVHGYTLDEFRVHEFLLVNTKYAFNLTSWLRVSFFADCARIFAPERVDVAGSAYGFRFITIGGLPIWLTHGIGKDIHPKSNTWRQTFMIMTAAGW